jgi:beta-mannosidase
VSRGPGASGDGALLLDTGWESARTPDGSWGAATVPGHWYLDEVDDPDHTADVRWYRCEVVVPAAWADRALTLRFEAVDYAATVWWDGAEVAHHVGGFAPFAADVPGGAAGGTHEVRVQVACPVEPFGTVWPHRKTALRGVLGHHDARPGNWSERGQERSTGGIWGPVTLAPTPALGIDHVAVSTALRGADADLDVAVRVRLLGDEARHVSVRVRLIEDAGEGRVADEYCAETWIDPGTAEVHVGGVLAAARLWWTWDHGMPHRYSLEVVVAAEGAVPAQATRLIGVRSIEVGGDWVWRLNGRPVFVRGCNYIGEQWLATLTPERAAADVQAAVGANLNALRVHAHVTAPGFYDACDAAGVLVWQDLPMQWGYTDDAETYRVARAMVADTVDLLGWRPSVAYWCAHNEAPWNEPWMADDANSVRPDQNQVLDHELAALFRRLDPTRPSLANSGAGDGHTYPGWYWGRWTDVRELPGGAFVTEYGAQAVPCLETLRTFLPEDASIADWTFHGFQHHEIHTKVGVTLLTHSVEEVIERTQRYQARLLQYATEVYRRKKRERVQGVMPFMLVDPWPCVSWSVIDHLRRPKAGYHALARAMQPVLPSIEADSDRYGPDDDPPAFFVWWVNDHHRSFVDSTLAWRLVDAEATHLDGAATTVHLHADAARRVMQAGPFRLAPGWYGLEADLHDREGVLLGANRWDFEVVDR